MSSVILTPQKAARLRIPTAAEAAEIARISRAKSTGEEFRDDLEGRFRGLSADLDEIPDAMKQAFGKLNVITENHLLRNVEGFESWSPLSTQPRILARSAGQVSPLKKMINSAFAGVSSSLIASEQSAVREFLCEAFWTEVDLVLHSEIGKSPMVTYQDLHDLSYEGNYVSSPNNEIHGRHRDDVWEEYKSRFKFVTFTQYRDPRLMALVVRKGMEKQFEELLYKDWDTPEMDACVAFDVDASIPDLIEHRRIQKSGAMLKTIEKFRDLWQKRTSVFLPNDLEKKTLSNSEQSVFTDLVTGHLNDDITDKDPAYVTHLTADSPYSDRANELDRFAKAYPGKPISPLVMKLFPDSEKQFATPAPSEAPAVRTPLPRRAPERWPTNPDKRKETPPEFAVRVYGRWMAEGLITRSNLKSLDPALFGSLDNWLKHNNRKQNPSPLPEGFSLLTRSDLTDSWVNLVQSGKAPMPTDPAELARYAMALRYRERTGQGRE